MMTPIDPPSEEAVRALLSEIAPGSTLAAINATEPGHYNVVHILETVSPSGELTPLVLKRYINDRLVAQKARTEFMTLDWLHRDGAAVPQPLYLDEAGAYFGTPAIVTRFLPGQILRLATDHPVSSQVWVRELAAALAKIHSVPWNAAAADFLPPVEPNLLWFLRGDVAPDYMKVQPNGVWVWEAVHAGLNRRQPVPPTFIHSDYSPGNILWDQGRITAVLDWEEGAFGEPAADVGYCRMFLYLTGNQPGADEFLRLYETATGRPVANLGFWQLAAVARPMFRPIPRRIFESPARERLQAFIADARQRLDENGKA